jgi:hypothetical protein
MSRIQYISFKKKRKEKKRKEKRIQYIWWEFGCSKIQYKRHVVT